MSKDNKNELKREIFTSYNEKYNIDYKYIKAMFSGYTCEFEYMVKKYGFTRNSKLIDTAIKKGKNGKAKMKLMSESENVHNELEKIVD